MSVDLLKALAGVLERARSLVIEDAELRSRLRNLGQAILGFTEPSEIKETAEAPSAAGENGQPAVAAAPPSPPIAPAPVVPAEPPLSAESLREAAANLFQRRPDEPVTPLRRLGPVATDEDLPLIQDRCRLKAEGARWAAERQRRMRQGGDFYTDIEPMDRDIISRAKALPDCFLWMNHPRGPAPSDLSLLENVAGCFDAVAAGVGVLRAVLAEQGNDREMFEQAVDLLAEAQSALRSAVDRIASDDDSDQFKVFSWLRLTATEQQIFIRRYMRVDDRADPTTFPDIIARIDGLDAKLQQSQKRVKQRRKLFDKVRYLAGKVADGGNQTGEHWQTIARSVDELLADGVPASSVDIRNALLPIIDSLPDIEPVPFGFGRVLQEMDHFLATRAPTPEEETPREPTPEVREAARLLRGRSMVLIGGERRPHSYQLLKSTLQLQDLFWIEAREHQSIERFEAYVAKPEVAVVVLAIRWSSHSFGEVKLFCDRYDKPLVRLPAGYNPNQVATHVLAQCSGRLAVGV